MVLTNTRLPIIYGRILIFYLIKKICFTLIHYKIENVSEAFGEVHALCRIEFLNNKQSACFQKYGHKQITYEMFERGYSEIQNEIEYLLPDRSCL